jgi:hypothetical protein
MKKKCENSRRLILWMSLLLLALVMSSPRAQAQSKVDEFFDQEYGYFFKYPAGWAIHKLPEGEANQDVRVMLQGPHGSSFMILVEKLGKKTSQENLERDPERKKVVEAMMSQTLAQIYKVISQNVKASSMKVGERHDLSNALAIKFYLTTLHKMPAGKPIVIAGIHAFPFGKDYSINFVMTAFWDPTAKQDQEMLTAIFNSFRLSGENRPGETPDNRNAPGEKPDVSESPAKE